MEKATERCKWDVHDLVPDLEDKDDIIRHFREIAHEKGLLSEKEFSRDIESEKSCLNNSDRLKTLFSSIGEVRSLLLLQLIFSQSIESDSGLGEKIRQIFDRLVAAHVALTGSSNFYVSDVFTSGENEFYNLCAEIVENGDGEIFEKLVGGIESKIDEDTEKRKYGKIDSYKNERLVSMCMALMRVVSNKNEDDDIKRMQEFVRQEQIYGFNVVESQMYLLISHLRRRSYGQWQEEVELDLDFPEYPRNFAHLESTSLSFKTFILATEITFLISILQSKFSSVLHTKIKEKLWEFEEKLSKPQERKDNEYFIITIMRHRNCMEALCHLGMSFTLKDIPEAEVNHDGLAAARKCLTLLVRHEVWCTLRRRWKMLTYGAMSKWFFLNGESEKAKICAKHVNTMVSKISVIHQDIMEKNAKDLLDFVQERNPRTYGLVNSSNTFEIPENLKEETVTYWRVSEDTMIVKTLGSMDASGPYYRTPFQYILAVTDQAPERQQDIDVLYERYELRQAIAQGDVKAVRELLYGEDPLSKDRDGKTSMHTALEKGEAAVLKEIGNKICLQFTAFINQMDTGLLHKAWLGYIPDPTSKAESVPFLHLRIVAIHNYRRDPSSPEHFQDIPIFWRQKERVNDEAQQTIHFEDIEMNAAVYISGEEAHQHFEEHSNLNIIYSSSVKSRKFATANKEIVKTPCVVFCCQVKGIIPIGEKEFPKHVIGLQTDVREGYAIFGDNGDDDKLRPGTGIACIDTQNCGTIGGFVELRDGRLAFITAAHILISSGNLDKGDTTIEEKARISRRSKPNEPIGKMIKSCFRYGCPRESSVDAALIVIDKTKMASDFKFPTINSHHVTDDYSNTFPRICNNRVLSREELDWHRGAEVLKYGADSKLTKGKMLVMETHVRYGLGILQQYAFYNQIGIINLDHDEFFIPGDSGSFCFTIDKEDSNTIYPFGMAIGKLSCGLCIVTPLPAILRELELDLSNGDKLFPSVNTNVSNRNRENLQILAERFPQMEITFGNLNREMSEISKAFRALTLEAQEAQSEEVIYERNQEG